MKICILGAGVVGLTTAWQLLQQGHDVAIIDRNEVVGAETSAGNGAQLSYAFVAPLASPSILKKIVPILLKKEPAILFRPPIDIQLVSWGLQFLRACTSSSSSETILELFALAALSRREISRVVETIGTNFSLQTAGKLVLYRDKNELAGATGNIEVFARAGTAQQRLDPTECLELEPALKLPSEELAGGIFTPSEQVADCRKFCVALATWLQEQPNARLILRTVIKSLVLSKGRLVAVRTSNGEISADLFILCLASDSVQFARECGLRLPIYPMKGYSITVKSKPAAPELRHSITDFSNKIVCAPLIDNGIHTVRVAGMADFVGYDRRVDRSRVSSLQQSVEELLNIESDGDVQPWAGLRPATPNGRPLIGWCSIENLLLNTGHGGLGWTLACGSARLVRDLVAGSGRTPLSSYRSVSERLLETT